MALQKVAALLGGHAEVVAGVDSGGGAVDDAEEDHGGHQNDQQRRTVEVGKALGNEETAQKRAEPGQNGAEGGEAGFVVKLKTLTG